MEIVTLMGWIAVTVCFATTLSILCEMANREKNTQKMLKEIIAQLGQTNERLWMMQKYSLDGLDYYNMRSGEWVIDGKNHANNAGDGMDAGGEDQYYAAGGVSARGNG